MSGRVVDDETTSQDPLEPAVPRGAVTGTAPPPDRDAPAVERASSVAGAVDMDLRALSDLAAIGALAAGGNLAPAREHLRAARRRRRTVEKTSAAGDETAPREPSYVLVRFAAALEAAARPATTAVPRADALPFASRGRVDAPPPTIPDASTSATQVHPLAITGAVRAEDVARAVASRATPFAASGDAKDRAPTASRVAPVAPVPAGATRDDGEEEGPSTAVHRPPTAPTAGGSPLPFRAVVNAPSSPLEDDLSEDEAPRTRAIDLAALIAANPGAPLPFVPEAGRSPTPPPRPAHQVAAPTIDESNPAPEAWARKAAERLTLAQFARVSAEVRESPHDARRVRASLGLDDDRVWSALHVVWNEHFERQPALRERFEALVEQFARRRRA